MNWENCFATPSPVSIVESRFKTKLSDFFLRLSFSFDPKNLKQRIFFSHLASHPHLGLDHCLEQESNKGKQRGTQKKGRYIHPKRKNRKSIYTKLAYRNTHY
jgi:hypothetical protein